MQVGEDVYKDCLTEIKSVQFKESIVQSDCKLDDLKSELGEIIFVDYKHHSSEKIIDIMLKDKVCHSYSHMCIYLS